MTRYWWMGLGLLAAWTAPAGAQAWDDAAVQRLVRRGMERREADPARGLEDFRARAHGFVFFLAQLGEEQLSGPPQPVKSDQLELEVYWKAPGASKQRIVGWRDRVDLPTDIRYHRDHLGIVQNGFADRIRLGEGQEVRDVPHPLAPDGRARYTFALVDSTVIRLPTRVVRVHAIAFRPRDPSAPAAVGTLFLDADGGDLVRMRFNFTRAAYRDDSLEDITIILDNGLWDARYWLPRRQEVEIRRRATWLDLPARWIIRGRWEIDGYEFNVGLPDTRFLGPEIVAAPPAERARYPWPEPLDRALANVPGAALSVDLDAVRSEVRQLAGQRMVSGLPTARPSLGAISDLVRFNRVEGLALGAGGVLRPAGGLTIRAWGSYALAGDFVSGRLEIRQEVGRLALALRGERAAEDIGDFTVASRLVNSIAAQEAGIDYGDYVHAERLVAEVGVTGDGGVWMSGAAGVERTRSLAVRASPARGSFRANPALGAGTLGVGRVAFGVRRGAPDAADASRAELAVSGGVGAGLRYVRVRADIAVRRRTGPVLLGVQGLGTWGSRDLPIHRQFVLGGRGTLPGVPHRIWGGRHGAWARVELGVPVPAPAIGLGPFASTGRQAVVAPFLAAGWADGADGVGPWRASGGLQPVVGVAVEWFHRLLRADLGWWPAGGRLGFQVDVRRSLWPIL